MILALLLMLPPQVTFSKDVAPIFQAKCQECHQPNSIAPMSLITYKEARPWARAIRERVITRQMPPWHIDRSVGVQKFKNDMSLTDEQVDTIVRWVDNGANERDPKDLPPPKPLVTDNQWQGVRDGYGPPDLIIRSPEYTMPAQHQDVWYRPMSDIPLNEPRWAKMVEIRPTNLKGRRVIHHSIAYLVLNNDPDAVNKGTSNGPERLRDADDLVSRRPQLMEWAIGKGYDLFRPGTGKLIVPGEKISWDQHIHAVGEQITAGSEVGIWFYKKGEEPKKRSYLVGFTGIRGGRFLDIPPNSLAQTEGFTVLKENAVLENFQHRRQPAGHRLDSGCNAREFPAAHAPARQSDDGRSDSSRRQHGSSQLCRQIQLQLDDELHLRRRCCACLPQGNGDSRERVVRQHE